MSIFKDKSEGLVRRRRYAATTVHPAWQSIHRRHWCCRIRW